jgi:hypothetical protein
MFWQPLGQVNLSGEFTVINHYLVRDLKQLGLWDDVMVVDLKHYDGSLRPSTVCRSTSRRFMHSIRS